MSTRDPQSQGKSMNQSPILSLERIRDHLTHAQSELTGAHFILFINHPDEKILYSEIASLKRDLHSLESSVIQMEMDILKKQ